MILGGCEVTPWQLAGTYASIARTLNHYEQYNADYNPADYHDPFYLGAEHERPGVSTDRASVIDPASLYFTFQAMNEQMHPGEDATWEQFASSQTLTWKNATIFGFR